MIEIIDVHKSFGEQHVLRGVNLTVEKGESMTVIGGSGSGKSVLLKHIIGLLFPDKGRVIIDGQVLNDLDQHGLNEVRKKFGMLFQMAALFDSLSGLGERGFFAQTAHEDVGQGNQEDGDRKARAGGAQRH